MLLSGCLLVHCCVLRRSCHAGKLLRLNMWLDIGLLHCLRLARMMAGIDAGLRNAGRRWLAGRIGLRRKPVPVWRRSTLLRCCARVPFYPMAVRPVPRHPMAGHPVIGRLVTGRQRGQKGMGRFVRH